MDASANVLLRVIHDLMDVAPVQLVVAHSVIRVDGRSKLNASSFPALRASVVRFSTP
jgi:hypothetical protein